MHSMIAKMNEQTHIALYRLEGWKPELLVLVYVLPKRAYLLAIEKAVVIHHHPAQYILTLVLPPF